MVGAVAGAPSTIVSCPTAATAVVAVEPRPWSLGGRFRDPPQGVRRYLIGSDAPAQGQAIRDLNLGEDVWISLVVRRGQPVQVRADTVPHPGDDMVVLRAPALLARQSAPEHTLGRMAPLRRLSARQLMVHP